MFKKAIESGLILFAIVILAVAFNFNAALYSSNLSWLEFSVSVTYLIIWAMNFKSALKNKNYSLIRTSTIFWIATFITSSITLYINVNPNINSTLLIPLAILLLTPLYGFEFIIKQIANYRYAAVVLVIAISFIFSLLGLKFLIAQKKNRI